MRIVIDLQGAQGQSRNRGIGRYTVAFTGALIRQAAEHDILLVLNGLLADSAEQLRARFRHLLPDERIRVWYPTPPLAYIHPGNEHRREAARELYRAFIARLRPDCLLVTSVFEGLGDDSLTAIGLAGLDIPVAVILYDLIPHIRRTVYLDDPARAEWYDEKLAELAGADCLLAISESSRREAIEHLDVPPGRVVTVSSAVDETFRPVTVTPTHEAVLRARYGIDRPFVLYTGGIDHRKNIDGLLDAFAALPDDLPARYQLVIVCAVHEAERQRLEHLARRHGMPEDALVLTGYVPDEDLLALYNLTEVFVFPSFHEGFGLPALEAMACGAAVIASNTTSLPEVVGRDDALFDPHDPGSIRDTLYRVLHDPAFRDALRRHGKARAGEFSWDRTARRALEALAGLARPGRPAPPAPPTPPARPRLAYVSPLPPERSGISDYSAMLLPALAAYYDIDLVVDQPRVALEQRDLGLPLRSPDAFREQADRYDRVIYQFGNSGFHRHMFDLLDEHPGIVVLHDFYLSGVLAHRELTGQAPGAWTRALYASHGYPALAERVHAPDPADVIWRYPANLEVLQRATGVIVHSAVSRRLAREWIGDHADRDWHEIPLVREPADNGPAARAAARRRLGMADEAFVVCSFGFMGVAKCNHRLLDAWLHSHLSRNPAAILVFVGQPDPGDYGRRLERRIRESHAAERIHITGWTDRATYLAYLRAADVAVQLRARSRGETSAAVLDGMNHRLATVVNAHGSMADLPDDAVVKLPEDFRDDQLARALERLHDDPGHRERLAGRAARRLATEHAPDTCARRYARAIEAAYADQAHDLPALTRRLATLPAIRDADDAQRCRIAAGLAATFPVAPRPPQLLLDVSGLVGGQADAQPLAAELLARWQSRPPAGYRLEPVRLDPAGRPRYARRFMLQRLDCPPDLLPDDPVEPGQGDLWLGLGLDPAHHARAAEAYRQLRVAGVHLGLADADALPGDTASQADRLASWLSIPTSRPGLLVDVSELARHDAGTGIQRVVRNILDRWLARPPAGREVIPLRADDHAPGYRLARGWAMRRQGYPGDLLPDTPVEPRAGDLFLGLDLQPRVVAAQRDTYRRWRRKGVTTAFVVYDLLCLRHPAYFLPGARALYAAWFETVSEADQLIAISRTVASQLEDRLSSRPRPPRIDWFHLGADLDPATDPAAVPSPLPERPGQGPTVLMVGTLEPRKGYAQALAAHERLWRENNNPTLVIVGKPGWLVDDLVARLRTHPERGKRLFWYENASDAQLRALYRRADCLLAASLDEGFGLPLIEAAREGLPILARDIPVFREVAGPGASYFRADTADQLAAVLRDWLPRARAPGGGTPPPAWQDWSASAAQLASRLDPPPAPAGRQRHASGE